MHLIREILMVVSGWIIHYHIRKLAAVNYRFTYIYYLPIGMEFWKTDFRCALVTFSRSQQTFFRLKMMLRSWERVADLNRDSCVEKNKKKKKKKKKTRPPPGPRPARKVGWLQSPKNIEIWFYTTSTISKPKTHLEETTTT